MIRADAMPKAGSFALKVALVLLFAAALWFRISSLESFPDPDGDEAWHAIQLSRMLKGQPSISHSYSDRGPR